MFYAVSFRIPLDAMGRRIYINGAALGVRPHSAGELLIVTDLNRPSVGYEPLAEVIYSRPTQRGVADFGWGIRY